MERTEVFEKINNEREYQNSRWSIQNHMDKQSGFIPDSEKQPAEWLNYIEYCLEEAKKSNYHLNKEQTLHNVRKIAGLAVACLEVNGCPDRV